MSEVRSTSDRPGAGGSPSGFDLVGDDLMALRSVTAGDQPSLETSLRAARRRAAGETGEGLAMVFRVFRRRPALATAVVVLVVAVGLLMFPVSYQRTVGYDVALSLDGAKIAQTQVKGIARGFQEALGAQGARVEASMENGRLAYVLKAPAPGDVRERARAFARELNARGYVASVETTPRRETVSGNVYAYAMSRVIEVSTDGKSAAEIESEIRQRLTEAGVTNMEVSVTDVGDQQREVKVNAEHQVVDGATHQELPELVLTKNGQPVAEGLGIRVMKKKDAAGVVTLVVAVTLDGKTTTAEVPNAAAMDDAALGAEIEERLLAAGIDVVVNVHGEEITVEKRTP